MTFVFVFVLWIASLCLHEFAHAQGAFVGGDTSVEEKGYLTLNPLRYTDPMLSIVWPLIFLALGGYGILEPHLDPRARETLAQAGKWRLWALFLVLWYVPPVSRVFWQVVSGVSAALGIPADLAVKGYRAFRFR